MRVPRMPVKAEKDRKSVDFGGCKPDFVHLAPKRGAVRSFIYPAEAEFPPKWNATYPGSMDGPPDPLFCLAPNWVYHASVVTSEAVSSYLPFSPLPLTIRRKARGGIFSVTLSVTDGFPTAPPFSQGILPFGVRTFLSTLQPSERPPPKSTTHIALAHHRAQAGILATSMTVLD